MKTDRHEEAARAQYLGTITIVDGKHGKEVDIKFTTPDGKPVSNPRIPAAGKTVFQFEIALESKDYQFQIFNPLFLNSNDEGPFQWDFGDSSPSSQKSAGIRVPPVIEAKIDSDRRWAQMTLTNSYHHRDEHRYSFQVRVVSRHAPDHVLLSPDPTLIEDPYDIPGGYEAPPSKP